MEIKENIKKHLTDDFELVQKIEKLMLKVQISNDNERNMLLTAFTRNILSHFLSINILMEKKLYNTAFSLERIFFESIVRLRYMYHVMNNDKITTIFNANNWDKHFPSIGKMVSAIDIELEVDFYSKIKESAYKMMNDYTHTGMNQIARNFGFNDFTIESSFEDELILNTLKSNKVLLKTTMVIFLERIGFENEFITKEEMDAYLEY